MPTYDFFCPACELVDERLIAYSERHYQVCVDCGEAMDCLVTAPNLHVGPGYNN